MKPDGDKGVRAEVHLQRFQRMFCVVLAKRIEEQIAPIIIVSFFPLCFFTYV